MADNSLISSYYYSTVYLTPIISRRLRVGDKADANKRDKWGRKIEPRNSTMFSDYYDWQIEGKEFIPEEIEFVLS